MPFVIIALILTLAGGGGAVYASQDATPGDILYSVKAITSQVQQVPQHASAADKGRGKSDAARSAEQTLFDVNDSITKTLAFSGAQIVDSNWYSHTVAAIHEVSGTLGITLTSSLSSVVGLASDDSVSGQSFRGLAAKLRGVAESIARGNSNAAAHQLDAFAHQLDAMLRAGHITQANYDKLFGDYTQLAASLNAGAVSANAKHSGKAPKADKTDQDQEDDEATTEDETDDQENDDQGKQKAGPKSKANGPPPSAAAHGRR